jgi:hypothetical protein
MKTTHNLLRGYALVYSLPVYSAVFIYMQYTKVTTNPSVSARFKPCLFLRVNPAGLLFKFIFEKFDWQFLTLDLVCTHAKSEISKYQFLPKKSVFVSD